MPDKPAPYRVYDRAKRPRFGAHKCIMAFLTYEEAEAESKSIVREMFIK